MLVKTATKNHAMQIATLELCENDDPELGGSLELKDSCLQIICLLEVDFCTDCKGDFDLDLFCSLCCKQFFSCNLCGDLGLDVTWSLFVAFFFTNLCGDFNKF